MEDDFKLPSSTPVKKGKMAPSCTDDSGLSIQLSEYSCNENGSSEEGLPLKAQLGDIDVTVIQVNDDDDDSLSDEDPNAMSVIGALQHACGGKLKWVLIILACAGYFAYFVSAIAISFLHDCEEDHDVRPLIYLTIAALAIVLVSFVSDKFGRDISSCLAPFTDNITNNWHCMKWVCYVLPVLGVVVIIVISAVQNSSNLMSLVGWLFFVCLLLFCSKAPRKIKWRPVLGGFAIQFYFAVLILKWDVGYNVFHAIGSMLRTFLSYTDAGSSFVLGSLNEHFFAFKVLPVIIFFSCVITMMYYLGIMQSIIGKLAFVMRIALGTTAAESMCAAGNIFVGQTEAPILIRPFLTLMTRSELHAVMVGGFSTIAGAVLAAYIMKGVPATHLLTASVMNAPAALAVSKILYPELSKSKISKVNQIMKEKMPYNNVIEAAAAGASSAICLVANVAANLIAFVALLSFIDSSISWFGSFVCLPELSFQMICHYVLMPLAYIMGVDWKDSGYVAELIGIKTSLNEFYAYDKLSSFIKNRENCLDGPVISIRSETIATYALCGFANLSSIGIQLGGLGPMAPSRLGDLAQIAVSALLGGVVTNLMSACVAGLLVVDMSTGVPSCLNVTAIPVNATLLVNSTDLISNGTDLIINAVLNTTTII